MKRTPLYEKHLELGGKIIDFGGWELPVQYTGIIEEHQQVRSNAGLFDVSHMGEIWIKGEGAESYVQTLITNDISKAVPGQVFYSPMCYHNGGVVDDLLVYKFEKDKFLLVVNAANIDKDYEWIRKNPGQGCTAENVSDKFAQLALQGPKAEAILQKLAKQSLSSIKFFNFVPDAIAGGIKVLISRSGYTGEDGFELYTEAENAAALWDKIMEAGQVDGMVPVGLGARDILRFEAALPLYGQEISGDITPLEAGLGKFVKLEKPDFIGKAALEEQKQKGVRRKLIGFEMIDRGVPRSHYTVEVDGAEAGFVTTGSYSPSMKKNLGLALVKSEFAAEGTEINIVVRGKSLKACVVKLPFYTKKYRK